MANSRAAEILKYCSDGFWIVAVMAALPAFLADSRSGKLYFVFWLAFGISSVLSLAAWILRKSERAT